MGELLGTQTETDEDIYLGPRSERARGGVAAADRSDLEATLFRSTYEQVEDDERIEKRRKRNRDLGHATMVGVRMLPPRRPTSRMGHSR